MLFFNKPKPSLADIIPENYVDIHSHLLPGIDDGAKDTADTILLINSLHDYGFSQFITTPHVLTGVWNNTKADITNCEAKTKTLLTGEGIGMPFRAAAEYLIDDTFLKLLKEEEELLTLKDNYVLVEMSYLNPPCSFMTYCLNSACVITNLYLHILNVIFFTTVKLKNTKN